MDFLIEEKNNEYSTLQHMDQADMEEVEVALALSDFIHERSFYEEMFMELETVHKKLKLGEECAIDGVRLDTGAKSMSVMCIREYGLYTSQFGMNNGISLAPDRKIRGIGGTRKELGLEMIQIPFTDLVIVEYMYLLTIDEDVSSLLSLRDMYENVLDLSVQGR